MAETQPRTFGRYTVERELGRGGMGIVYAATHEVLGRRAAIKVLLNEVSRDSEAVERFINEARAASAIQHPSIVQVFEVEHAGDTVYIVMELLHGESLASRLKSHGPLPIATAVGLARQCANALEAAHRAGIVHRDLKPDNVFLVPDAEVAGGERVKLLDFGVAKLVGDGTSSVARTVTGAILGTPHYMSPEQCEGAREVDPRSDLYSLGCMVFQMVAGRLPFTSAGIGGLIGMHLHVAPPLLRSLRPDAPPELEDLVARLLAKSPDERVQSATEVAARLVEIPATSVRASGRIVPAPALVPVETGTATMVTMMSPTSVERVTERAAPATIESPVRKRRWLWPAIAIGAIGAIGIAVIAIAASRTETQQPRSLKEAGHDSVASLPNPPPAPVPPAPPPMNPHLTDARRLLAARDFDGAHTRGLLVTDKTAAAKLETEIREARALAAYDRMRAPDAHKRADEVKRDLEIVYANTEKDSPLRGEADRIWEKVKSTKRPSPPVVAKAPPPPPVVGSADQQRADDKAKHVALLLKKIRETSVPDQVVGLCWELSRRDNTQVPWDKCVAAQCKLDPVATLGLIGLVPDPQQRFELRKSCPIPSTPPPQQAKAPRPNAPPPQKQD